MIRSRWIRPEDLSYYEEIGYDYFKISGREMSTEKIILTTKAYSNRKYDGNLLNILNGVTILDGSRRKVGVPEIKPPSIDNSRLDGFLDFFKRKNCFNECADCDYCKKIAEQIVEVHKSENEFLVDILDLYGKNMISLQ
jgi:collagenase-like PrtC family protease